MRKKILWVVCFICVFCANLYAQQRLIDVYVKLGANGTLLTGTQGASGIVQQAGTVTGTNQPLCTDSNGNTTTTPCAVVSSVTNQAFIDVAVSSTTPTTVVSKTVTMPATGCPCRVFISYSTWVTTGSSGVGYSFWVSDGTNVMAPFTTGQSNATSGAAAGVSYAGFSSVTYANGANVTFTLTTEGDHSYTVKEFSPISGTTPPSAMQLSIFQGN